MIALYIIIAVLFSVIIALRVPRSKLMPIAVAIMFTLVILVVNGSIAGKGVYNELFFGSSVVMVALATLGLSSFICSIAYCFQCKKPFKIAGFVICHLGVVLFLIGAAIGHFKGVNTGQVLYIRNIDDAQVPVEAQNMPYSWIMYRDGQVFAKPFNFDVRLVKFEIDYYQPDLLIYRKNKDVSDKKTNKPTMKLVKTISILPNSKIVNLKIKGLKDENIIEIAKLHPPFSDKKWLKNYKINEQYALVIRLTPKEYRATVKVFEKNKEVIEKVLRVNHPLTYKGWRIYYFDYDRRGYDTFDKPRFIITSAKKDPGRGCVVAGIWMLIIGTAILCFRRERRK